MTRKKTRPLTRRKLEYEEKMEDLREAAKEYWERRMMDPLSIAGSRVGSVVNLEEDAEERDRDAEEVVREIQGQTNLDHRTQTRNSDNVHFQIQPFQSTMATDRSTTVTPQDDGWIGQVAT